MQSDHFRCHQRISFEKICTAHSFQSIELSLSLSQVLLKFLQTPIRQAARKVQEKTPALSLQRSNLESSSIALTDFYHRLHSRHLSFLHPLCFPSLSLVRVCVCFSLILVQIVASVFVLCSLRGNSSWSVLDDDPFLTEESNRIGCRGLGNEFELLSLKKNKDLKGGISLNRREHCRTIENHFSFDV